MESKSVRLTISELPWAIRVTLLTLYIALVNSYALGVVYPSLKTDDFMSHLLNLVVYIGLIVPLIILAFKSLKRKTNLRTLISGFIVFVIAMAVTSSLHLQSPEMLVLHGLFYLLAGFAEETLWRGKLWNYIKEKGMNNVQILAVVTCHFVTLHIPFAILGTMHPLFFLAQVLALGIVLGTLRIITKRSTVPAMAHAVINALAYT